MGIFGKKKNADAGYGYATEPGAIPVATPVSTPPPYVQAQAQQMEKLVVAQPVVATGIPAQNKSQAQQSAAFGGMNNDPTLSRGPMIMAQCPHCQQQSRTRVTTAPVWQTWAASGVLCFVFWPIFWVPLVVDNCKDTSHYCVLCGAEVGKVSAFQDCCVTNRG